MRFLASSYTTLTVPRVASVRLVQYVFTRDSVRLPATIRPVCPSEPAAYSPRLVAKITVSSVRQNPLGLVHSASVTLRTLKSVGLNPPWPPEISQTPASEYMRSDDPRM